MLTLFRMGCLALIGASAFSVTTFLGSVPVPPPPALGHRGAARRRAIERHDLFRSTERAVRRFSGLLALVPHRGLESRQELELKRADYPLGLTPDEYSALAILSAAALGGVTFALTKAAGVAPTLALPAFLFGLILPSLQVREVMRKRVKNITRGLPHAIEIIALCMGAGADFPGAVRLLVEKGGSSSETPLHTELGRILEELDLGHTRRDALRAFSERVPSPAVRDFVNAVVQAEERGNPLAKVIQIQGRMLNQRRSVAAEEAAARAGVMMIMPLMLLLCAILLLLLGPFIAGAGKF